MALDTAEKQLLRAALTDMKHFDLDEHVKTHDALVESGLIWSNLNFSQDRVAGFTRKGMHAISLLASRLRKNVVDQKAASNESDT